MFSWRASFDRNSASLGRFHSNITQPYFYPRAGKLMSDCPEKQQWYQFLYLITAYSFILQGTVYIEALPGDHYSMLYEPTWAAAYNYQWRQTSPKRRRVARPYARAGRKRGWREGEARILSKVNLRGNYDCPKHLQARSGRRVTPKKPVLEVVQPFRPRAVLQVPTILINYLLATRPVRSLPPS